MTVENKCDLILLQNIINSYEHAVLTKNVLIVKAYERDYDLKSMYEDYNKLSEQFMQTYVKSSDSRE